MTVIDDVGDVVENASVYWTSDIGMEGDAQLTDSLGTVTFSDLAAANYHIVATQTISENYKYQGDATVTLQIGQQTVIILVVRLNSAGLKINEIYFCGCGKRYFYDQYIELYNGSADTLYLDNSIIFACNLANDYSARDNDKDGDIDFTWIDPASGEEKLCMPLVAQLHGSGHDYPILPGEFKVVAADAINHLENEKDSINLSKAEFEFVNENDPRDPRNEQAPDYENLLLGDCGYTSNKDLMLSLASGFVAIASGEDNVYCDGIDITTIWDSVEYSRNVDHEQQADNRLETGFAGVGVESYSRKSIQRIRPGYDTNNSTLDFLILDNPTPGSWY